MKRAKFDRIISQVDELPTLPAVAVNVLKLIRDDRATTAQLSRVIELDVMIAARVLQVANSAYYCPVSAAEVTDVHRAIVVLGFANIRNVVMATCLRSMYGREFKTNHFTARDLWMHSVMVAVLSRTIAEHALPGRSDEAFLAGLLHDVGMIAEWHLFPEVFPQVLASYHGTSTPFVDAEQRLLGFDHCQAGAALLRRWRLPKPIRDAAAHHHHDHGRRRDDDLAQCVRVAEQFCAWRGDGFFDTLACPDAAPSFLADAGIDVHDQAQILEKADQEIDRARDLMAI